MSRSTKKEEKKRRQRARLQQSVVATQGGKQEGPRVHHLPDWKKWPHPGVSLKQLDRPKQVRHSNCGGHHYFELTWCARIADKEGYWQWNESRAWTDEEWTRDISPGLNEFEGEKWRHVESLTTGSGHRRNHSQEVASLCQEARERWSERNLEEFDVAFRFRFGSLKRAWGIRLGGHFFLVWWERYHQIYPTEPNNT